MSKRYWPCKSSNLLFSHLALENICLREDVSSAFTLEGEAVCSGKRGRLVLHSCWSAQTAFATFSSEVKPSTFHTNSRKGKKKITANEHRKDCLISYERHLLSFSTQQGQKRLSVKGDVLKSAARIASNCRQWELPVEIPTSTLYQKHRCHYVWSQGSV